jgi:predicted RNA binding protein YcfA (HicA-like mRNA interferase family)
MRHELKQLLRAAKAAGWQVRPTGSGHLQLRHPAGGIVVTSSSPSDRRALANLKAQLRRAEKGAPA